MGPFIYTNIYENSHVSTMKYLQLFESFDAGSREKLREMSIDALAGKNADIVLYLKGKPSTEELHKDLKSLDIDFEGLNAKKKAQHYTVGDTPSVFNFHDNGPVVEVAVATTYAPNDKIIDKLKSVGWSVVSSKRDRGAFIGGYSVVYMKKGECLLHTIVADDDDLTTIKTISKIVKE